MLVASGAGAGEVATSRSRSTSTTGSALLVLLSLFLLAAPALAAEKIEARSLYRTADGIYVDVGSDKGLREGATGWLQSRTANVGRFEVAKTASGSAFLRFLGDPAGAVPDKGERLTLFLDPTAGSAGAAPAPPAGAPPPPPGRTLKRGEEGSAPLLAPDLSDQAFTEARNVFHGRVTLRQAFQAGTDGGDLDYALTRLRTSGSLERIDATPWALEWSAELSYRDGDGLERTRNHETVRAEVFQLSLFRRFDDRSFLRLGRFLPRELPAVGFLDGAHGEVALSERLRFGTMAGLKPTLDRLTPTADAPAAALYVTANLGDPKGVRYFVTAGVLGQLYEGDPDRLAILVDQRLGGATAGLSSTSEVDFDVDRDDRREGVRVTRWNLLAWWDATEDLRLAAGLDRFELVDTGLERDAFDEGFLDPDELFEDDGYWRYFGRVTIDLPADLALDAEASWTDASDEDAVRGALSLTRLGLPGLPDGSLTVSAYNLRAQETTGYGGRVSAMLPFLDHRLTLQPAVSFRWTEHETTGARFFDRTTDDAYALDASLRATWIITSRWTLFGGLSFVTTDGDQRILADVGVTWKW